jgi:peptidoglycan/xylan/chitin deacetylase (PgdA/CDA1 family)
LKKKKKKKTMHKVWYLTFDDYYAKPIFCVDLTFKAMKSVENKEKERFH